MKPKFNHVLLVDDDEITNFLNQNLLQELQVANHIHVTQDGLEALDFIQQHWMENTEHIVAPEDKLILLDINMSLVDGFGFLDAFREIKHSHQVAIALLTTSINERDLEKAKVYQIQSYIEKPLNRQKVQELWEKLQQDSEEE